MALYGSSSKARPTRLIAIEDWSPIQPFYVCLCVYLFPFLFVYLSSVLVINLQSQSNVYLSGLTISSGRRSFAAFTAMPWPVSQSVPLPQLQKFEIVTKAQNICLAGILFSAESMSGDFHLCQYSSFCSFYDCILSGGDFHLCQYGSF